MPDFSLPRQERLRSLKAIRRLFDKGRSGFVYPFRYVYLVEECGDSAEHGAETRQMEVMFSVPKKFHKRANRRNLLKRRSREAYRLNRESLCERLQSGGKQMQLALIYSTKECHTYKTIENGIRRVLEQIGERV